MIARETIYAALFAAVGQCCPSRHRADSSIGTTCRSSSNRRCFWSQHTETLTTSPRRSPLAIFADCAHLRAYAGRQDDCPDDATQPDH